MDAVMNANTSVVTLCNTFFCPITGNIIIIDVSTTFSKVGTEDSKGSFECMDMVDRGMYCMHCILRKVIVIMEILFSIVH